MRNKRLVLSLLLIGLLAPSFIPPPASADVGMSTSPADQLLLVNANVRERNRWDMADWDDMTVFVRRVLAHVPYAPDIVLLQEVRRQSAELIAVMMGSATGQNYELAVSRGNRYARRTPDGTIVLTETAILMNTTTTAKLGPGGHVTFSYTPEEAAPGSKIRWKKATFAALGEIDGDFGLRVASVHMSRDSTLASTDIARAKKLEWSSQIDQVLTETYPAVPQSVVGGDFNQHRCDDGKPGCEVNPFWQHLIDAGYRDSVRTMVGFGNPIDFIFSSAPVVDATADFNYDPDAAAGTSEFYSDHRFRWALVEQADTTAPLPPTGLRATDWNEKIRVAWAAARDGGTGIANYEVFRAVGEEAFVSLGTTTERHFVDTDVVVGQTYRYYVVAHDGVGLTATSETITEQAAATG
jgi:exonuclease III